MGAEPPAPWSRWDRPGVTYNPPPLISQPFGDTGANGNAQPFISADRQTVFINGIFTRQEDDRKLLYVEIGASSDATASLLAAGVADYIRCYYRDVNNQIPGEAFLQCARSVGCCETDCCVDTSWYVNDVSRS